MPVTSIMRPARFVTPQTIFGADLLAWYDVADSTIVEDTPPDINSVSDLASGGLGSATNSAAVGTKPHLLSAPARIGHPTNSQYFLVGGGVTPAAAFTSIQNHGVATLCQINSNARNETDPWDNERIVRDASSWWGHHVKGLASPFTIISYYFDSAARVAETTLEETTWAVVWGYVDGGNVFVAIDDNTPVTGDAITGDLGGGGNLEIGGNFRAATMDWLVQVYLDAAPTAQQRADFTSWAKGKFGV